MKTIKIGCKGAEVKALQEALNKYGYHLIVDGIFGKGTETAVRDFQKSNELSVDGIVGAKTWSKLGYSTPEEITPERIINEIIVHCAATPEGSEYTSKDISAWHEAREFSYYIDPKTGEKMFVGYHYLIHLDGTIEECRPIQMRGCHVINHNAHSIGICFIGGVAKDGKTPKDTRTDEQKAALLALLKELKARYPNATIHGHREFANKACPSFDAKEEYKNL